MIVSAKEWLQSEELSTALKTIEDHGETCDMEWLIGKIQEDAIESTLRLLGENILEDACSASAMECYLSGRLPHTETEFALG